MNHERTLNRRSSRSKTMRGRVAVWWCQWLLEIHHRFYHISPPAKISDYFTDTKGPNATTVSMKEAIIENKISQIQLQTHNIFSVLLKYHSY